MNSGLDLSPFPRYLIMCVQMSQPKYIWESSVYKWYIRSDLWDSSQQLLTLAPKHPDTDFGISLLRFTGPWSHRPWTRALAPWPRKCHLLHMNHVTKEPLPSWQEASRQTGIFSALLFLAASPRSGTKPGCWVNFVKLNRDQEGFLVAVIREISRIAQISH
jgi:hypothetical protein